MKALNFVIGMIVGMVLLVVAVAGAVLAAGTLVSVGQIESTLGTDIFDDESSVNDLTVLELVQNLVKDLQNLDGFTIEKLKTDYGVKIPDEISGIDITPVFGYPITEVPNHLGDIVNNMTLRDVGEFLNMDFETEYPDLRVLQDNLDEKVNVALDNVLSSIDDEKMTVYTIERDFGLSLGENNLITTLKHTPLSSFAAVMDHLPVGTVVDADSDLFVAEGAVALFVVTDEFVEVPAGELTSSLADESLVAETYIAGADENGIIYREMRYVMNDDGTYEPDNSCYASSFDAAANTETYYRHIVYTAYDSAATYGEGTVFAVKTFLNDFVSDGEGGFVLADGGFFTLDNVFTDLDGTTLNAYILSDASVVKEGGLDLAALELYVSVTNDDDTTSLRPADTFGVDPAATVDDDTRLDDNFTGWVRIHVGDADPAMQVIAGETISTISGATDAITALKLGEVLDIDENSAKILQTLADTPINKMSDALDTITLADATDIAMSEYVVAKDGAYVKVTSESGGTYYTLYNPTVHTGENIMRYDRTVGDGDASVALQRLAGTTIPNISAAFSGMVLGDALNIEVDTFAPVNGTLTNGETYYVFNKLGYPERVVYEDGKSDPDAAYFERTREGEGNAVLKQLAYVNIDNVSEAMDGIIENTLLSDIIDVVEYAVIEVTDVSGDPSASYEQWFFEHDAVYTVGTGENAKHYTFVYDGNGKYYMTDVVYLSATDGQKAQFEDGNITFSYVSNGGYTDLIELLTARGGNIYFKSTEAGETVYKTNPALLAYYIAQSVSADTEDKALAALKATYSRVETADGDHTADIYTNVAETAYGGLYVFNEGTVADRNVSFGGYTLYDAENPAHWGAELFFKYSDGFYPASSEVLENGGYTLYTYTPEDGFTEASDPTGSDEEYYVKLAAKTEDGRTEADGSTLLNLYYFTLIDENFEEGYTVYANRECDTVYVKDEGGDWVKVGSEWVAFDENDPEHEGLDRFNAVIGYIGNSAANDGGVSVKLDRLSNSAVTNTIEEKSPTILITLLQRQVTIGSLNDAIDTLTIGELMEIEPGSVFDNDVLRNATIENLSEKVSSLFTDMTIGTLLEYANVSVSSEIAYILQDVKIADFFGALEYHQNGQLTVNMGKLFGIAIA